jgi:DNA-binding SARP family transcriptional activator
MGEQAQNHDGQGVLRLRLLGKPRLLYRSTSLADELAKKEQALLVYLACQPGKRFSRDHLATLLWGETTQSRARYNLRRALWHLRSALKEVGLPPEEYLHTQDDAVFVPAAAPYRVDVLDFERELQACLQDLSVQLSAASDVVRRVDKSLDRYRGEFLRGFSVSQAPDFEEWLVLERERLFLLLLRALTSLIQGFIAWGERDEAIAACQRLLELDPLQEDIHRLLMRLYWETGQRAHALRQYRTYQDLLERELDVEPLAETEELYQRILERESSPRTVSSLTLTSRLTVPTAAPESLPRPRLLDRLDRGLSVPLTLLSAPPGYGKTTLLAQWLARSQDDEEVLFAWYRVSEADNAPLAFIEGLATSLARLHPAAGEALREVYGIAALQGSSRQAAGIVVNAIASLEPAPLVMILDDLEHMTNPDSQEVLRFLLGHLPANGHLYLATRVDPLLPLPRLRIRGQLLELRASELRFTEEEARALLEQVPDLRLDPAEIDELVARAEGWIAPLWLATNALGRFAASLDDVWDGTFAYLRQEVLALQPSEIRDFLLRSAVLDHLTPSLCETVVEVPPGIDNAAELLSELERRNLFLRRTAQGELGEEPRYVYHPLFLAFLRAELRYASTVEVTSIHRRAGAFWEHQGDLAQALFHFRQAGDDLETARLLEKEAPLYLREGRVEPLAHWLEQLGPEVWEERPRLTLSTGQLRQAEGRLDAARRLYRQAVRDFEARGDVAAQGDALLALADLALLRGRYAEGIGFAEQALERWDASDGERRAEAWSTLGQLQACQGAFSAAEASLSEGERAVQERDHPLLTFRLLRLRAWVAYLRDDYHRAMGLNRLAEQEAGQDVPARVVAAFRNPVPSILREWGETPPAWRAAQQR